MLRIILLFFPKKYISYLKKRDQKLKYLFKYERLNLILTLMYYRYFKIYQENRSSHSITIKKESSSKVEKHREHSKEGAISEAFENSSRKLARQDVSEAVKEIGSANIENNGVDKIGI